VTRFHGPCFGALAILVSDVVMPGRCNPGRQPALCCRRSVIDLDQLYEGDNKWKAALNAQIEQLKAAPEFRYKGKWKR